MNSIQHCLPDSRSRLPPINQAWPSREKEIHTSVPTGRSRRPDGGPLLIKTRGITFTPLRPFGLRCATTPSPSTRFSLGNNRGAGSLLFRLVRFLTLRNLIERRTRSHSLRKWKFHRARLVGRAGLLYSQPHMMGD